MYTYTKFDTYHSAALLDTLVNIIFELIIIWEFEQKLDVSDRRALTNCRHVTGFSNFTKNGTKVKKGPGRSIKALYAFFNLLEKDYLVKNQK